MNFKRTMIDSKSSANSLFFTKYRSQEDEIYQIGFIDYAEQ